MTTRTPMAWENYREAYPCEECGRPPVLQDWRNHISSVEAHNRWHETASPQDLVSHETEGEMARHLADKLVAELRPFSVLRAFGANPQALPGDER